MDYAAMQIGTRVRITSKNDVNYEGTFVQIDIGQNFEMRRLILGDVYTDMENMRFIPLVSFEKADINNIQTLEQVHQLSSESSYALQISGLTSVSDSGYSTINGKRFANFDNVRPFEDTIFFKKPRHNYDRSMSPQTHWRIPQYSDYIGRSGDPKDLEMLSKNMHKDVQHNDYDFEKFNQAFFKLCVGFGGSDAVDFEFSPPIEHGADSPVLSDDSGNVSDAVNKGAVTKIQTFEEARLQRSTAYDKTKSFFDTISSFTTHRFVANANPNWREKNIETFGAPMIYHERISQNKNNVAKLPSVVEEEENLPIANFSYADVLKLDKSKFEHIDNGSSQNMMSQLQFKATCISATSTPYKA